LPLAPVARRSYANDMGALRGSQTFSRFFVIGELADDEPAALLKRIKTQVFKPLDPEEDLPERHGWANVMDPFDLELDHEKVFFNEYLTLGFRHDRWAIPGPLLKSQLREAEQKVLEKKGIEKLGKQAKAELKAMVIKKLRRQLPPATKSIDFVWNRNEGLVLFYSHAKRLRELVQEMFEKTFKVQLLLESPGTGAERQGMDAAHTKVFANLEMTSLAMAEGPAPMIQKELS
jgi:recombination associated protein RdgC